MLRSSKPRMTRRRPIKKRLNSTSRHKHSSKRRLTRSRPKTSSRKTKRLQDKSLVRPSTNSLRHPRNCLKLKRPLVITKSNSRLLGKLYMTLRKKRIGSKPLSTRTSRTMSQTKLTFARPIKNFASSQSSTR